MVFALHRLAKMAARAAQRMVYVSSSLTATGYVILAMTVAAIAMVAMLSATAAAIPCLYLP
jgi:hypothetical protein